MLVVPTQWVKYADTGGDGLDLDLAALPAESVFVRTQEYASAVIWEKQGALEKLQRPNHAMLVKVNITDGVSGVRVPYHVGVGSGLEPRLILVD